MTNQESRNPRLDRIPEVLTAEWQLPCLAAEDDPRTP